MFQLAILRNEEGQRSRDLVRAEAVVLTRPYTEQGVPPHLHVLLAHLLGRADTQQRSYEFHRVTICANQRRSFKLCLPTFNFVTTCDQLVVNVTSFFLSLFPLLLLFFSPSRFLNTHVYIYIYLIREIQVYYEHHVGDHKRDNACC